MTRNDKIRELKNIANEIRKLTIKTVHYAKAGHLGGPFSAIDILTTLYFDTMNINPEKPHDKNRDRFVLSKGHAAISLYCTMALRGYFPLKELETFDKINSRLQAHPDMKLLPGLDFSTGSLGQGISGAVGMALGAKLTNKNFRVYCMIGDGETQEGQVWEALDIASRYSLDNLTVILDYNKLQQYGFNDKTIKNPLMKFNAFDWHPIYIDGNSISEIMEGLEKAKNIKDKPTILIANTVKGKGVSFMEKNPSWHSRVPTDEELELALNELSYRMEE